MILLEAPLLIGILSDSHGRAEMVARALALFDELGVAHVIHCGDVGGIEVFEELAGRPLTFVWGNTDVVTGGLMAFLNKMGITPPTDPPAVVELAGKRLAIFHGHEPQFEAALRSLRVDYLLHGHTHLVRDDRVGGKRVINPGALHRARVKTVATLDLATDALQLYELGGRS